MNKLLNKGIDELNRLLIIEYNIALNNIYNYLMDAYEAICVDKVPQMSHLYSYNRYYTLIKKINTRLNELGAKEVDLFTDRLTKMYEDTAKQIGTQLSISTDINEQKLIQTLKTPWIGKENYSYRIWKNKGELEDKIKDCLTQSIITGKSPEAFSDILQNNLIEKGYYPIKRLLNTEMTRMHLQSTVDKYKEVGITKVRILTANDDRVCELCIDRAGKIYNITEILNILPNHPNCRCSIVANI